MLDATFGAQDTHDLTFTIVLPSICYFFVLLSKLFICVIVIWYSFSLTYEAQFIQILSRIGRKVKLINSISLPGIRKILNLLGENLLDTYRLFIQLNLTYISISFLYIDLCLRFDTNGKLATTSHNQEICKIPASGACLTLIRYTRYSSECNCHVEDKYLIQFDETLLHKTYACVVIRQVQ